MLTLSIDTAFGYASCAITRKGIVIGLNKTPYISMQTEELLPMIEKLLDDNKLNYADFNNIAVTIGPGSFTGIRIGLSAAKGLKIATNLPIIPVTSFEIIASMVKNPNKSDILVVLDARKSQLFCQRFNYKLEAISSPIAIFHDEIVNYIPKDIFCLIGDGALLVKEILSAKNIEFVEHPHEMIDAKIIGEYVQKYNKQAKEEISPLYIRDANINKPKC